jgi:hypothetical protein
MFVDRHVFTELGAQTAGSTRMALGYVRFIYYCSLLPFSVLKTGQPPVGPRGLLFVQVLIPQSDAQHPLGLVWSSDNTLDTQGQTSVLLAAFEPTTSASERSQTQALHRADTRGWAYCKWDKL